LYKNNKKRKQRFYVYGERCYTPKCINTILLVNIINSSNNNNNKNYWNDCYLMYETVDKKVINQ